MKDYIKEQKYGVDANKWFAHYEKVGWIVGKKKMVSWQAGVRTWQYSTGNNKKPLNIPSHKKFSEDKFDESKKVSPERVRQMLIDNKNKQQAKNEDST